MTPWLQAVQLALLGACVLGALHLGHSDIAATLAGGMLALAIPQRRNGGDDAKGK